MTGERVERRLAAVLAVDVAGYSRLMGADELGTLAALKMHRREIVDPAIAAYNGRIVKTTGDGLLVEFASAVDAVTCAVAVQEKMAERTASGVGPIIQFRVGINIGDIIIDSGDIFGDGVNVAARVENECQPGGVLLSGSAFEQVRGKTSLAFDNLGERSLKNIELPVRLYAARSPALPVASAGSPAADTKAQPFLEKPSIAVLPFQNMSGDPEQEYFSDGITEDIITDLSKIAGLLVIARNSSFTYKGRSVDIRTVGRELGVTAVLEGSVRRGGSRLRITAQLIDARTGTHVWAERYDREMTDIFAVQDDVTTNIVDALRVTLTPAETARMGEVPTRNMEAHDLFLRGREALLGNQNNKETFELAVRCFTRAIELDPDYADPYTGLAHAYNRDFQNKWSGRADSKDLFAHYSELALKKGPNLPYAHYMAALVKFWNRDAAGSAAAMEKALALNPNFGPAMGMRGVGKIYDATPLDAIADLERAARLDPLMGHQYRHFIGSAYLVAGDYGKAAEAFRERIRLSPGTDLSRGLLVAALGHLGDTDEARRVWAELRQANPNYSFAEHLARLPFTNSGDAERIREGFAKAGVTD